MFDVCVNMYEVFLHIDMYLCIKYLFYVCMYACMYVCIYVCMCIYIEVNCMYVYICLCRSKYVCSMYV